MHKYFNCKGKLSTEQQNAHVSILAWFANLVVACCHNCTAISSSCRGFCGVCDRRFCLLLFAFCFWVLCVLFCTKTKNLNANDLYTKCFKAFSSILFKKLQWYSSFYLLRRIYLFFLIIVY